MHLAKPPFRPPAIGTPLGPGRGFSVSPSCRSRPACRRGRAQLAPLFCALGYGEGLPISPVEAPPLALSQGGVPFALSRGRFRHHQDWSRLVGLLRTIIPDLKGGLRQRQSPRSIWGHMRSAFHGGLFSRVPIFGSRPSGIHAWLAAAAAPPGTFTKLAEVNPI